MLNNEIEIVLRSLFLNLIIKGNKIDYSDLKEYFIDIKLNNSSDKSIKKQLFLIFSIKIDRVIEYTHARSITKQKG